MKKFITPQTAHGYFGQTATKKKTTKKGTKKGVRRKGKKGDWLSFIYFYFCKNKRLKTT